MKNLDLQKEERDLGKINWAVKDGNEDALRCVYQWTDWCRADGGSGDGAGTVLAGRGVRALTSQETRYYERYRRDALRQPPAGSQRL